MSVCIYPGGRRRRAPGYTRGIRVYAPVSRFSSLSTEPRMRPRPVGRGIRCVNPTTSTSRGHAHLHRQPHRHRQYTDINLLPAQSDRLSTGSTELGSSCGLIFQLLPACSCTRPSSLISLPSLSINLARPTALFARTHRTIPHAGKPHSTANSARPSLWAKRGHAGTPSASDNTRWPPAHAAPAQQPADDNTMAATLAPSPRPSALSRRLQPRLAGASLPAACHASRSCLVLVEDEAGVGASKAEGVGHDTLNGAVLALPQDVHALGLRYKLLDVGLHRG